MAEYKQKIVDLPTSIDPLLRFLSIQVQLPSKQKV